MDTFADAFGQRRGDIALAEMGAAFETKAGADLRIA